MYCTRTVCIVPYSGTHPTIRIIPTSPNATLQARSSYGQHQSSYFDGSHICWASLPHPQGMHQARQSLAQARHACLQPLHAKDWLQGKRICPIVQRAFFKRIQKLQNHVRKHKQKYAEQFATNLLWRTGGAQKSYLWRPARFCKMRLGLPGALVATLRAQPSAPGMQKRRAAGGAEFGCVRPRGQLAKRS